MASWQQIGQMKAKQHNEDSWQLKFYFYSSSTYTIKTIPLVSDLKLRRGKPNGSKFDYIKVTQIDLKIVDENNWLSDLFEANSDEFFQVKIYKNSSLYFVGNLVINKNVHNPNISKSIVTLKIYDGLARLKDFNTLPNLGSGRVALTEIMRKCLNVLDYQIDIRLYEKISIGSTASGVNSFNALFIELSQFGALKENMTFYDIIDNLTKTFGLTLFQENGLWVFLENNAVRSGTAYKIGKYLINYSTGAVTSSGTVDLTTTFTESELGSKRLSAKYKRINEFNFSVNYKSVPKGYLNWKNPKFIEGSTGWTSTSGTGLFTNNSLILAPTDEYYQDSGDIDAGEVIIIDVSVACARMVLDATEIIDDVNNPLFAISYITTTGATYYYNFLGTWNTSLYDKYGVYLSGVSKYDPNTGSYKFDTQYSTKEKILNYEITVPPESGKIRMILYGGGTASGNNYPLEISALFTTCNVRRKEVNENIDVQTKGIFFNSVATAIKREIQDKRETSLFLHDLDAFLQSSYWFSEYDYGTGTTSYSKTNNGWLGSKMLLELVSANNILFNIDNISIDMDVLPGNSKDFTSLLYGSFGSLSPTYYLPIYDERILIVGTQRIVAHQHVLNSATITTYKSYSY